MVCKRHIGRKTKAITYTQTNTQRQQTANANKSTIVNTGLQTKRKRTCTAQNLQSTQS